MCNGSLFHSSMFLLAKEHFLIVDFVLGILMLKLHFCLVAKSPLKKDLNNRQLWSRYILYTDFRSVNNILVLWLTMFSGIPSPRPCQYIFCSLLSLFIYHISHCVVDPFAFSSILFKDICEDLKLLLRCVSAVAVPTPVFFKVRRVLYFKVKFYKKV